MEPKWLDWAKRLQAIAQSGLTYTESAFDKERYKECARITAEIMAEGSSADIEKIAGLFEQETGYATPKIDVRGVVFRDRKLLFVKERADSRWALPGGFADVGEAPSEGVAREVYEESGFRTRAVKLLALYDRQLHPHRPPHPNHIYKLFFLCELEGGAAGTSHETEDVAFFAEDEIPPLSAGRVTEGQIRRMFEHLRNPDWPADFD